LPPRPRPARLTAATPEGHPAVAGAAADPTVFRFFNEIGIIEQLARNRFERVMPQGLTVAQFSVLNHFVRLGGERSLVELARSFQVSKAAMGKLVGKLYAQGLVAVRANPADSRGKLVSVTRTGARVRDQAVRHLAPTLALLRASLGDDHLERMLPGLVRVRQWLDENREPSQ